MFKRHWTTREELRDTLGNRHPLGKWTVLYAVIPAIVILSLAGQALGILAGLLMGAGLFVAIECGMGIWAKRKVSARSATGSVA